jgi:hypothetical protein
VVIAALYGLLCAAAFAYGTAAGLSYRSSTKNGSELHSVAWEAAEPRPLFIGLEEITAIYEGKA